MNWLLKVKRALFKTTQNLNTHFSHIFLKSKTLSPEALEEIKDLLISTDMGFETATTLVESIAKAKFTDNLALGVKSLLCSEISKKLQHIASEIVLTEKPHVIVLCGINGNGKTTTAGKLGMQFKNLHKKAIFAACDTFRASAVEQLTAWSESARCDIVAGKSKQDPPSIAYQAYERACKEHHDVVIVDTAGRLHSNQNLMLELAKTIRVLKKIDVSAPHHVIMVIDGNTGQNALQQVETFLKHIPVTGFIVTKLDGGSKGGILLALADKYKLPVYAIGVGEEIDDLIALNPQEFATAMLGL